MLWNGSSLETVENLPIEDARNMWELHLRGMSPVTAQYMASYTLFASNYSMHSKKGTKTPEFKEVFSDPFSLMECKPKIQVNKLSSGTQAVLAMQGEGMPEWLAKAAMEEITDGY